MLLCSTARRLRGSPLSSGGRVGRRCLQRRVQAHPLGNAFLRRRGIQQRVHQGGAGMLRQIGDIHPIQSRIKTRVVVAQPGLCVGALGCIAAVGPRVVGHDQAQQDHPYDGQTDLKGTHGIALSRFRAQACAMDRADSISTATMRETPCSCIVTPINCCAISMAILL